MEKHDLRTRLREAFARMNERFDELEERQLRPDDTATPLLSSEIDQTRAMLDVIARRLSMIAQDERQPFEQQLSRLRSRWSEAKQELDAAMATGGDERERGKERSRRALDEVENGLVQLTSEMNARFAGHPPTPGP